MERVAFLVERTGQRLSCLLNPETVVVRRRAGVRQRQSLGGQLTGARLADDALLFTGGGRTELELDLLFDVTVAGSSIETDDVRELTRPLWDLSETRRSDAGVPEPELARFVWGKVWNMPGVIAAVAERLDYFTAEGAPRRSWLRLRMLRVDEPGMREPGIKAVEVRPLAEAAALMPPDDSGGVHEVLGGTAGDGDATSERLDELSFRYYGEPAAWRVLATANNVDRLPWLAAGRLLHIPSLARLRAAISATVQ
jgi:hypothetical protein